MLRNARDRRPAAVLRAGGGRRRDLCARLARAASREQPRQRPRAGAAPWRPRAVGDAAADPAHDAGDGRASTNCPTRAAPHPSYGDAEDPRLGDDPLLGHDHARLLRRLHVLLDHRARRPHHPEPLGGLGPARRSRPSATRRRASPASSPTSAGRPPTCIAWPARTRTIEAQLPAACPASIPASARTSTPATTR